MATKKTKEQQRLEFEQQRIVEAQNNWKTYQDDLLDVILRSLTHPERYALSTKQSSNSVRIQDTFQNEVFNLCVKLKYPNVFEDVFLVEDSYSLISSLNCSINIHEDQLAEIERKNKMKEQALSKLTAEEIQLLFPKKYNGGFK